MRMDKLTMKSQEAMQEAQLVAEAKGNQELQPEHLLLSLLSDNEGIPIQILQRIGIDITLLKKDVEAETDRFPKVMGATPMGQLYISARLKKVFDEAWKQAEHLSDEYVSTEHLLLGIVTEGGPASELLQRYNATEQKVLEQGDGPESGREVSGTQALCPGSHGTCRKGKARPCYRKG